MSRIDPRVARFVDVLDRAFRRKGWHGTTLRGALRGMTPREALRRPAPGANRPRDLLLHRACGKYVVRRRVGGEEPDGFRRSPANWPAVPRPADARALRADRRLLDEEHRLPVAAVRRLRTRDLDRFPPGRTFTRAPVILGAAAHDAHHGGQIRLLKRLGKGRGSRRG